MPPRAERMPLRLATRALTAALVVLAAVPVYLTLAPSWRPAAARLACAAIVIAGGLRAVRAVRRVVEAAAPSALEAPAPASRPPQPDERFARLRDELVFSVRSRRYFDTILWPRLSGLAGGDLARPAERGGFRREGPSLRTLEGLIAEIERRL